MMVISKEWLTDVKEKFERAVQLVDEESKLDPPTDPYKSHYTARDILQELQNNIKNGLPQSGDTDDYSKLIYCSILGHIQKNIGAICLFTQEHSTCEQWLNQCIELLRNHKMTSEAILPYLEGLNLLGILWSHRQDAKKSKEFLDEANELYKEFKASELPPYTIYDICGTKDEIETGKGLLTMEKLHTLTLFYLAQIIGTLGDMAQSAMHCYSTLKRQLEFNDYEPIDWALNAATLSQYYFTQNNLIESRHLLASANYMLDTYEIEMITPDMSEDQKSAIKETFRHRQADVWRCWAKYGLYLLSTSIDRLMEDDKEDDDGSCKPKSIKNSVQPLRDLDGKLLKFESIIVTPYEDKIIADFCLIFDDAKIIFNTVQNWINKAKEYYNKESEASEYAKLVQDHANLYKYLAFFIDGGDNQAKLHKGRADLLEALVNELNPTYYRVLCQELWYELGITYSTMLDIKLTALEDLKIDEPPTPHAVKKINNLCERSIKNFIKFIDSFKEKDTNELPTSMTPEELDPILYAYFHLGRLYYKIINPNKETQITNIEASLKYYQLYVNTYENSKDPEANKKAELGACKEMVSLLPLKILKLKNELAGN